MPTLASKKPRAYDKFNGISNRALDRAAVTQASMRAGIKVSKKTRGRIPENFSSREARIKRIEKNIFLIC